MPSRAVLLNAAYRQHLQLIVRVYSVQNDETACRSALFIHGCPSVTLWQDEALALTVHWHHSIQGHCGPAALQLDVLQAMDMLLATEDVVGGRRYTWLMQSCNAKLYRCVQVLRS